MSKSVGFILSCIGGVLCLGGCAARPLPTIAPPDPVMVAQSHQAFVKTIHDAEKPPRPLTAAEQKIVSDTVGATLKDPFTAHFIFVADKGLSFVCGQVNSKNSYGAYTGFKRFAVDVTRTAGGTIVAAKEPSIPSEDMNDPDIGRSSTAKVDNDACNIAGY